MKLRLSRAWRVLLASCLLVPPALWAYTVDLSEAMYGRVSVDLVAPTSTDWLDWTEHALTWGPDGSPYREILTMSGHVTLASRVQEGRWGAGGRFEVENGRFEIGSEITLDAIHLNLSRASLVMKGRMMQSEESGVESVILELRKHSMLDLSRSEIDDVRWSIELDVDSSLIMKELTLREQSRLLVGGVWREDSNIATFRGNVRLNANSGELLPSIRINPWTDDSLPRATLGFRRDPDGRWPHLKVTGTWTVESATSVAFFTQYVHDYSAPDAETAFLTVGDVQGHLGLLVPYASYLEYSGSESETLHHLLLENRKFVSRAGNGGYDILLVDVSVPDEQRGDTAVFSSGVVTGDLGAGLQQIDFGSGGGVVDATGVRSGLRSDNIFGSSGTLVTAADQAPMEWRGSQSVGYSIVGAGEAVSGAALLLRGRYVSLEGALYRVSSIALEQGIADISSGTRVQSEGGINANAALNNYGQVVADLRIGRQGAVDNRGRIEGNVSLSGEGALLANNGSIQGSLRAEQGTVVRGNGQFVGESIFRNATMHIGNSPGRMTYTGNTTLDNATLEFTLDGLRASQGADDTEGTYSTVVFEGGELSIQNGLTLHLELTDRFVAELLNRGDAAVALELVDTSAVTNTDRSALGSELAGADCVLTGSSGAVLESVSLSPDGTLRADVNQALLAALVTDNGGEVANTLWSSARTLEVFSAEGREQLSRAPKERTHAWVSGLGAHRDTGGQRAFRFNGAGAAVGVARGFGSGLSTGLSLGQSKGRFKSDSGALRDEQRSTLLGLAGQYGWQTECSAQVLALYAAYGRTENEADTRLMGSPARACWDDEVLELGVQWSADLALSEAWSLTPFVGLEYTRAEQEDFAERSATLCARYRGGNAEWLRVLPGLTLRRSIALGGSQRLMPEFRLAYEGDLQRDCPSVQRSVAGYSKRAEGSRLGRHALTLRAGVYWTLSDAVTLHAFYTAEVREHETAQGANAGLSVDF